MVSVLTAGSDALPVRAARAYLDLLHGWPVATKSITSALVSAAADLAAQTVLRAPRLQLASAANYALLGLVVTGPATHHFYRLLDVVLPAAGAPAGLLRLAADRLLFGPLFLLSTLYLLNRLEGRDHAGAVRALRRGFAPLLRANLKFWLPLQYVNVNYVPQPFRVLFGNVCAFFWIIIMAGKRRRAARLAAERRGSEECGQRRA